MGHTIMTIIMWLILGSLLVLVVKNPSGATALFNSGTNLITSESKILSGGG